MKYLFALLLAAQSWAQIQTINSTDLISTGPGKLNNNFSYLSMSKPAIFDGNDPPGVVTASVQGDLFIDTTHGVTYQCYSGTTCTAVGAGNWVAIGQLIPTSVPVTGTSAGGALVPATRAAIDSLGYVSGGGTANAQTVTLAPAITSLTAGLTVCWFPTAANTNTTPTLAVSGLTAKTITKLGQLALVPNDLQTTGIACVKYDGTYFELQNPLNNIIGARYTNASAQTIANMTESNLQFPTVVRDDDGFWSSGTNTQLTAPAAGWYLIGALVRWSGVSGGQRRVALTLNGAGVGAGDLCHQTMTADSDPSDPGNGCSATWYFSAGDYIQAHVYQDNGSDVDTEYASIWMTKL